MTKNTSPILEGRQLSDPVTMGSERSFGFVFATVFTIIGLWPLKMGGDIRFWPLASAAIILLMALALPSALRPFNYVWFKFGQLLHHVVTPVIMGALFYLVVSPVGMLMRATGKDPLRLKQNLAATSYWIPRIPHGPAPDTMKNQF